MTFHRFDDGFPESAEMGAFGWSVSPFDFVSSERPSNLDTVGGDLGKKSVSLAFSTLERSAIITEDGLRLASATDESL